MKPLLLLDVDGVLADFVGGVGRIYGLREFEPKSWNVAKELGIPDEKLWRDIEEARMFWLTLSPYPWAKRLYDELAKRGDIVFVTSPPQDPSAAQQKLVWLATHFQMQRNFVLTPLKNLLAMSGRILVDDNDENCRHFSAAGGTAVLFPQPWNEARDKTDSRIEHVLKQIDSCTLF